MGTSYYAEILQIGDFAVFVCFKLIVAPTNVLSLKTVLGSYQNLFQSIRSFVEFYWKIISLTLVRSVTSFLRSIYPSNSKRKLEFYCSQRK